MVIVLERHRTAHEVIGSQCELRCLDTPVHGNLHHIAGNGVQQQNPHHGKDQIHGNQSDIVRQSVDHPDIGLYDIWHSFNFLAPRRLNEHFMAAGDLT